MDKVLLWLVVPLAVLDWIATFKRWKALEFILKPAVIIALLAWLWQVSGLHGNLLWFAAGLAFSLVGDVALLNPDKYMISGIAAFSLAQISCIAGFNPTPPPVNLASLSLVAIVFLTTYRIHHSISANLVVSGRGELKIPVLLYCTIISLMVLSALLTLVRPEWAELPAWFVSAGALLFFASDFMLAWDKFVESIPCGHLRIIISYHLGQLMLVTGAMLHYMK